MKKLILFAGAAMLAATAPALAKPGNSHGNGHHKGMTHGKSGHAKMVHGKSTAGVVQTSKGRLFALNATGACPPGLAKKANGCLPPGQAKKLYNVGQRYNRNFGNSWTYDQIPDALRTQYSLAPDGRYYYRNGYLYQVDPKTMLVQQVISALLQ